MTDALLKIENLSVSFPVRTGGIFKPRYTPLMAVNNVSFEMGQGEVLGVVGESGCGKSTLGRAILRLIPPTAGRVTWLGRDLMTLGGKDLKAARQDLQIVFQDPLSSHNPRMTVGEIIGEPLTVFRPQLQKKDREELVRQMMRNVRLRQDFINRYPHELSGGQCQRVSIARAMIIEPKLVVCDEPVSALDVSTQAQIIRLIKRLQKETGVSILFISHDLAVVWYLCQRVLVMYLGKVMEIAGREALFKQPLHPYTKGLISSIPIPDPELERKKKRIEIKGDVPSPLDLPTGCVFRTRCPYATHVCLAVEPELETTEDGRRVACHHWRDVIGDVPQLGTAAG